MKFTFWVKKNPANMSLNSLCQEKLSGPQLDLHNCVGGLKTYQKVYMFYMFVPFQKSCSNSSRLIMKSCEISYLIWKKEMNAPSSCSKL